MIIEIRCQSCNKLLAKASGYKQLQVKCSRCKTLNSFHSEDRESPTYKGKKTHDKPKSTSQSSITVHRSKAKLPKVV